MSQQDLIAAIGPVPTVFHTNYQRVSYMLSMLRTHADPSVASAAKSLYDGSISLLARGKATSTPEAVANAVMNRYR